MYFHGRPEENIDTFIQTLETMAQIEEIDHHCLFMAAPHLVKGEARRRLLTRIYAARNWGEVKKVLTETYGEQTSQMQVMEKIRQMRQDSRTNVTLHMARMYHLFNCLTEQPSEEMKINMVLQSLRPDIRQHVLGHRCKTLEDLSKALQDVEENKELHRILKGETVRTEEISE